TYAWTVTRDGQALTSGSGSSLSFTPTSAGTYLVTLRAADKDGGMGTATVTIQVTQTTQTNQTITWSNPADIPYGTALSGTQLNATVSVPGPDPAGALTYSPGAGTVLNAAPGQSLSVTAAATANYNQATQMVTLNV